MGGNIRSVFFFHDQDFVSPINEISGKRLSIAQRMSSG
jgi:hypothetical protein